ncbi:MULTISPECIES: hypothetical protein [unclassified Streptomyces]|uniref:hypothetical protein n=1 Tax=unclassified Streptomyces TaxID=2593676 RepID=UPI00202F4283|nr:MULTISPECIES: hypothetical protein [unclassified Streptomyces]MCM1970555.1 hypothetical protein [Streptomyces sp. G1]MCX5301744.1 hypothetical protein [Streptomyces sp. NBC_00193]
MSRSTHMWGIRTATGACAAVVAAALAMSSAVAAPHQDRPAPALLQVQGLPSVIEGHAAALGAEGVTWDPTREAFLVGSATKGTVSVLLKDGTTRVLVDDPRLVSTYGVHVDAARNRVLVAYADPGVAENSSEATTRRISGIGIYDLRTGQPIHVVDLTRLDPGRDNYFVNDFAIGPDGTAYVADVFARQLYRVAADGRASVLAADDRFAVPGGVGINGIVWHPAGYLLAVNDTTGQILRVDPGTRRVDEVRLPAPVTGGDGLAVLRNGDLVVVTNTMATAAGREAVTVLRSGDCWNSAAVVKTVAPWPVAEPTTVADTPYGSYVLSGGVGTLFGGGAASDTFTLRKL